MDALWPDLTVTEASLQRAVSLARRRAGRRRTGAGDPQLRPPWLPLRSRPRLAPTPRRPPTDDAALRRRAASPAPATGPTPRARFAAADRRASLTPGRPRPLGARARMPRPPGGPPVPRPRRDGPSRRGRAAAAARAAVTLAKIELERSAAAAATAGSERAEALLAGADGPAGEPTCSGCSRGSPPSAAAPRSARARLPAPSRWPRRPATQGLRALTLAYKGFYNLSLGRVGEGADQQNHAAAIALSERGRPDHRQPRLLQHPLELPHLRRLGARPAVERRLRDLVRGELRRAARRLRPAPRRGCSAPRARCRGAGRNRRALAEARRPRRPGRSARVTASAATSTR